MKRKGFLDILGENLGCLPETTQLIVALDPRSLISTDSPFMDSESRLWKVFAYRQNDLELRSYLATTRAGDERLLIIVQGVSENSHADMIVDISYIPDLLDAATQIIDCSPPGLLESSLKDPLPPSIFEEPILSLWADDINKFVQNIKKCQKTLGKGRTLDKYDAQIIALATSHSELDMESLAALSADHPSRILYFIRTVMETSMEDMGLAVLKGIIRGPEPTPAIKKWLELDKSSLSRLLYFGLVTLRYAIPNGLERIQLLGLLDVDIEGIGESVHSALNRLKNDYQLHSIIAHAVEESSTLRIELNKLMKDAKFGSFEDGLAALDEEIFPAVVCAIAEKLVTELLPNAEGRAILAKWQRSEKRSEPIYPESVFRQEAIGYRELLKKAGWIESCLAAAPSPSGKLLNLVDNYRRFNIHLLELEYTEISEKVRRANKNTSYEILKQYVNELQARIEETVSAYDRHLANTIKSDFQSYAHFERLNTNILRNLIQAGSPIKRVVWVIILDGVRLDTWDRIICPRLQGLFETGADQLTYLATLPSYTDISRVSFLAGKLPPYWKDYNNNPTSDHNILLSRHLMLGRDESRKKLKIVTRVEEKEDQEIEFGDAQFRCMIFNVCDTWIHNEAGNLLRVNEIVKEKFEKVVLPELQSRINPQDIVVVTSDHGFIELKKNRGHKVDITGKLIDDENITYRYIYNEDYAGGAYIDYGKGCRWTVAVGYDWFQRQKPKGKPARYTHGGVSMAEMVVPGILLKKRVEKRVELEMAINPVKECLPGEMVMITVKLRNLGTEDLKVALEARLAGRLVAQEAIKLLSGSPYQWAFETEADPKANIISLVAKYSSVGREKGVVKRQVMIPVKEKGASVGIDTSALDVFDEK